MAAGLYEAAFATLVHIYGHLAAALLLWFSRPLGAMGFAALMALPGAAAQRVTV